MLKAIGSFFGRIWSWIKNTAWVQPLLIVGILFGVIFLIPVIANGVNGLIQTGASSVNFYERYKLSLDGDEDSDAQKLADALISENPDKSIVGNCDKFILMFAAKSCEGCNSAFDGFKLVTDAGKWKTSYIPEDGKDFKLITIFIDEETSTTNNNKTAFDSYLDRNSELFELAADCAWSSNYYVNDKISDTDIQNLEKADHENFVTPTCILYEFNKYRNMKGEIITDDSLNSYGPTEVMFQIGSGNGNSRAQTITDFWNHDGDFNINGDRKLAD